MTELQLFLMRVPGLSELEAKGLIELLNSLDDFTDDRLNKFKTLLTENGLVEQESKIVLDLLLEILESK